ncbi:MAG: hypothetical protein NTY77_07140 [Elusimicrobia bacterium]|nr:hypothetical protein [Elusimicrobiota bacterium]
MNRALFIAVLAANLPSGAAAAQVVRTAAPAATASPIMPVLPGAGGLSATGLSLSLQSADLRLAAPSLQAVPILAPAVQAAPALSALPSAAPLAASIVPASLIAQPGESLTPAQAVAAQSQRLETFTQAAAPILAKTQDAKSGAETSKDAAAQLLDPSFKAPADDAATPVTAPAGPAKAAPVKLRGAPLLKNVAFSPEVSAQHQSLLIETLTRRKAGWTRGLAAMGVKLDGPTAPVITVRAARDIAKGAKVEYTFDWMQSETHVGSFKAYVTVKNLNPELRRGVAPEPAKEKQIRMRFKKTVLADVGGIKVESQVTPTDIEAYLESKGLRLLSKGWDGYYTVSVTGQDQADAVADALSGKGIVLYATPMTFTVPEANQVQIAFKESTVRPVGGLDVETSVSETEIGEFLSAHGLRVLSVDRDGLYTVGAEGLASAAAAQFLQKQRAVFYAKPVQFDPPAASMLIIEFYKSYVLSIGGLNIENSVSEDDISNLLQDHGLMLVKILNNGAYKVARVSDATPGKDLVAAVSAQPIVKQAMALGGVTDEQIRSAAKGVESYKGRPWSSTEYNMAYGTTYWGLEERGATPEQLKLFEKLCDEAPVRAGGFNPWSGD